MSYTHVLLSFKRPRTTTIHRRMGGENTTRLAQRRLCRDHCQKRFARYAFRCCEHEYLVPSLGEDRRWSRGHLRVEYLYIQCLVLNAKSFGSLRKGSGSSCCCCKPSRDCTGWGGFPPPMRCIFAGALRQRRQAPISSSCSLQQVCKTGHPRLRPA